MSATGETLFERNPHVVISWNEGRLRLLCGDTGREFSAGIALVDFLHTIDDGLSLAEVAEHGPWPAAEAAARAEALVKSGILRAVRARTGDTATSAGLVSPLTTYQLAAHADAARAPDPSAVTQGPPPRARLEVCPRLATHALRRPEATPGSRTLEQVLDRRRSIRTYGPGALGLAELERFLWNSARVKSDIDMRRWQTTSRPSASAGARHSLELFLLVRDVGELDPGVYHYDPFSHSLSMVDHWHDRVTAMQRQTVCVPAGLTRPPAVSIYLAALSARVTWKYPRSALAAIYRDTGCLIQTMYLVATDLELAPCATASFDHPVTFFPVDRMEGALHVGNFALGTISR